MASVMCGWMRPFMTMPLMPTMSAGAVGFLMNRFFDGRSRFDTMCNW